MKTSPHIIQIMKSKIEKSKTQVSKVYKLTYN